MHTQIVSISSGQCPRHASHAQQVILQRGGEFAACDGLLVFDREAADAVFEDWRDRARMGEEGFQHYFALPAPQLA